MTEAELLFSEFLGYDRLSLYLNAERTLDKEETSFVSRVLKRRLLGEPLQYILGKTEFMGLDFKVNKDVFIPRPETEILVETVIKIVRQFPSPPVRQLRILDLGTGSGCIAISLARLLPTVVAVAVDISGNALSVARENALMNNVAEKIKFIQSDLFTPHQSGGGVAVYRLPFTDYHLIISNPPYIPTEEIESLQPEISYEPPIALDGGSHGLDFYRRIIKESPPYLKDDGFLIMEMGVEQRKDIENLLQESGYFKIREVIKDYHNIDRVIVAQVKR